MGHPFEQQVSYAVTATSPSLSIGLLWKGHETRLDYIGGYQDTAERYIDFAGDWTETLANGVTQNVPFTAVANSNPQAWSFEIRGHSHVFESLR